MARTKDFDENEVLKKAVCLFWDKGYNGTSMQDLVDGLGISRSSLYDTFGDKHQLYLKALDSYRQGYGSQLCALTSSAPSSRQAIRDLLDLVVNDLLNDEQRKGCFMVNAGIELASHDKQVNQLVCDTENQLEQAFLKVIRQGQENGQIANDKDPLALTRFLNNTVKGLQVSARSTTERSYFEQIVEMAMMVL
ncbi:TetR/AcrR family transcriptional regulator [Mucilaginibacter myungsuensis]|uniref:TetR/AcrR family transcriptional regulator n=1 Tax=Mucilaginibacter myungsuensis TaxID=649104 RepID=A0A929L572_9SPHI|nr:TetR/AcrR family transcriptional regulator [Mucilaginibacter myungsuensis]MBE9664215.1 TetR/AcrR family transcriptional regulator [Mucilaginibacter myungsuensis]MDN3599917.1 TetR/AcrR family transcriptional regulator [Mucilaginibacter myungsuensis]